MVSFSGQTGIILLIAGLIASIIVLKSSAGAKFTEALKGGNGQ